jgi:uncharacterized protein (DUF1697 family)
MKTWIALFRGINVSGNNTLPMADLREHLEGLKLRNVQTYIQSGNVVFNATAKTATSISKKIKQRIKERHRFDPNILILSQDDLVAAVKGNPFPKALSDPKTLHFFFLAESASNPNTDAIKSARKVTEDYELTKRIFYLRAPEGIGRSKLAANVEKYLGVATTARNFRTVEKLMTMVEGNG